MGGHRTMIGKAMITAAIVTSAIAGSGKSYHLSPTKVNARALQVSIDYNNKKIFLYTEIIYIIRVVQHCFVDVLCDVVVILGVKHVDYMGP